MQGKRHVEKENCEQKKSIAFAEEESVELVRTRYVNMYGFTLVMLIYSNTLWRLVLEEEQALGVG